MDRKKITKMDRIKKKYESILELPFGIECDDGWAGMIDRTLGKLRKLYPKIKVVQIKEKFGELRIYTGGTPYQHTRRIAYIITLAERESANTCEICGKPGTIRKTDGRLKAMCDQHYNARKKSLLERVREFACKP